MNAKSKSLSHNTRRSKVVRPARIKALPAARLTLKSSHSQSIFIAGPFNGWNPTPLLPERLIDGKWVQEIELPVERGDYMFVVHVVARA